MTLASPFIPALLFGEGLYSSRRTEEREKVAEICGKYATDSQSQKASGSARTDEAKVGALAAHLVDDLLRVIEATTTLNFAAMTGISRFRCGRSASGGLTDLALCEAVADADDHGDRIYR
jgi:hypothetical protein